MIATAITAFFYLRVVVLMYFADGPATAGLRPAPTTRPRTVRPTSWSPAMLTTLVIAVCAVVTLLLGILPSPVLELLTIHLPLLS